MTAQRNISDYKQLLKGKKEDIEKSNKTIFQVTSLVFSLTQELSEYSINEIKNLATEYTTAKIEPADGSKQPEAGTYLVKMKKIERIGKKFRSKLSKFNIILQEKRTEFMKTFTKTLNLCQEALNIASRPELPSDNIDDILKLQQLISNFTTRINRLNVEITKMNMQMQKYRLFLELLSDGTLHFPGETMTPIDLKTEIDNIQGSLGGTASTSAFYKTLEEDILKDLPKVKVNLENVVLDQFGSDYINGVRGNIYNAIPLIKPEPEIVEPNEDDMDTLTKDDYYYDGRFLFENLVIPMTEVAQWNLDWANSDKQINWITYLDQKREEKKALMNTTDTPYNEFAFSSVNSRQAFISRKRPRVEVLKEEEQEQAQERDEIL
ncbi:DhNV_083 [Dikerogammarus haemobaphes nudivirus]|nr:DhNV_083 [Dikerogammarus haemobaphes nudivirus]